MHRNESSFVPRLHVVLLVAASAGVSLGGCVGNQAKISMLQAPEVADASKYRAVSVARFGGQYGDAVSNDIEGALLNAKIQEKPVYRSVARAGDARSVGHDTRTAASTARSLGTEAIFSGEVTQADVQDQRRTETEYVCDRTEKPNKLFSKCVSGHNQTVNCTDRAATMQVQVRLIDAQTGNTVYAEAITKSVASSGCGSKSPTDGRALLGQAKDQIVEHIKRKVVPHDQTMNVDLMGVDDAIRADSARARFDGAVKFAKEARLDRACEMFREIYDAEKKSVALNYNLGVCEESAGAFWKANEHYRIADRLTNEPNKLINGALTRNEANIKKAGALAQNRTDLVATSSIEAGAAPQTFTKAPSVGTGKAKVATQPMPLAPQNITSDALLLDKRTALVIGNGKYRRGALLNPVNDARAMATELREAGFQVIEVEDAIHTKMGAAIDEFGRAIKQGGVALVFYAGHGMQVKGENYLVPVDADLTGENDVPYKTVALGQILSKLDDAKPRVNIVILDACRDNPFARSWRSTKGGLASIDAPSGTVIAFATAPGKTAADGAGANGLFTSNFLRQLRVPNQKIEDVLKNTRKAVAAASNNEQVPWDSSSLTGDFYFKLTSVQGTDALAAHEEPATVSRAPADQTATRGLPNRATGNKSPEEDGPRKPSLGGFLDGLADSIKGALSN